MRGALWTWFYVGALLCCGCSDEDERLAASTQCEPNEIACGGECVDPVFDVRHCGTCGNTCEGQGCFGGKCTAPDPLPAPRGSHAMALGPDGLIYVFGGGLTNHGAPAWTTVVAYDPLTNRWEAKPDLSDTRNFACAVRHTDDKIYLLGGTRWTDDFPALDQVEVFDVELGWEGRAPLARARRDHACALGGDGRLYAISGASDGVSLLDSWEVLTPDGWALEYGVPVPSWGARAATGPDGKIYLTGGAPESFGTPDVYVLDPAAPEPEWASLAPMNQARFLHGCTFGPDGHLYVMGGFGEKDQLGYVPVIKLVERYDIAANTWTIVASMPDVRFDVSAVSGPGGRIYLAGGGGTVPETAYADLFVYDVANDTWYP